MRDLKKLENVRSIRFKDYEIDRSHPKEIEEYPVEMVIYFDADRNSWHIKPTAIDGIKMPLHIECVEVMELQQEIKALKEEVKSLRAELESQRGNSAERDHHSE